MQKTIGNDPLIFFWESDNMKFDIYSKIDSVGIYNIFPVEIKIDTSKLKSELISVNFSFKRKIKFMINGEQSVFLNTSDFTENLWEENKTLDINEKNHFLKFDIPLVDNEKILNKKKLNFNVNSEANNKKYFSYLMPTYKGNNIQCEYFLKIKPIFSGNKIYVHDFQINIELFHDNNSSSVDAINEINKIPEDTYYNPNTQTEDENTLSPCLIKISSLEYSTGFFFTLSNCLIQCPENYYYAGNNKCKKCHPLCKECFAEGTNTENNCLSCANEESRIF